MKVTTDVEVHTIKEYQSKFEQLFLEAERNLVALGIQRRDIVGDLLAGNQEAVQLPFNPHEEHAVHLVHILVQIDDIAPVVGNETGHFRDDALLVGTMQQ